MAAETIANALVREHVLLLAQDAKRLLHGVNAMGQKNVKTMPEIVPLGAIEMIAGIGMTRIQNMTTLGIGVMTVNAKSAWQNVSVGTRKECLSGILHGSRQVIVVGPQKNVILGPSDQLGIGKPLKVMMPRIARNGEIERRKEKRRKSQHGWTLIFRTVLAWAYWVEEAQMENLMAYKRGRKE